MSPKKIKRDAVYDPVTKRYKATCPECGYFAARAKREAALWALDQHIAYEHEAEPS